ncbi:MAG: hypothetical protein L7S70_06765, partial [Pseudomonadales bacterium]|nr:hypothetical protein [Pseudomonadales bacterium]
MRNTDIQKTGHTKKNINKHTQSFPVFILLSALLVALPGQAQDYVLDPDWPKPLPEGIEWGQVP